jgi:hypothetical protein
MIRTKAQRSVERRAILYGIIFVAICNAQFILTIIDSSKGWFHRINSMTPMLVWIGILYFFSWAKIRTGLITLVRGGGNFISEAQKATAENFLFGLILRSGWDTSDPWQLNLCLKNENGIPALHAFVSSDRKIVLNDRDTAALLTAITEDGDPYKIQMMANIVLSLDFSVLTHHERFQKIKFYDDAHKHLKSLEIDG